MSWDDLSDADVELLRRFQEPRLKPDQIAELDGKIVARGGAVAEEDVVDSAGDAESDADDADSAGPDDSGEGASDEGRGALGVPSTTAGGRALGAQSSRVGQRDEHRMLGGRC